MDFKNKLYFIATLVFPLLTSEAFPQETPFHDYSDSCGESAQINGYKFIVGEDEFISPDFLTIIKNNKYVYRAASPMKWDTSHMGMKYYKIGEKLLISVWNDDCVDIFDDQYFLMSKGNDYIVNLYIGAGHNENKFFELNDRLYYWSEWYCSEYNETAQKMGNYIQIYDQKSMSFLNQYFPKTLKKCMTEEFFNAQEIEWETPLTPR